MRRGLRSIVTEAGAPLRMAATGSAGAAWKVALSMEPTALGLESLGTTSRNPP
jgi:hypothetical protein